MSVTVNCPTCLPIDCPVPSDLGLYSLATAAPRAALKASAPAINCPNPDDLFRYSLQSGRRFSNIKYTFVLDCPAGYSCAGGYYPRTIVIPADTIIITVPDNKVSDDGSKLTSDFYETGTCCNSTVIVSAPAGTTIAALTLQIEAAFAACALAKANCENISNSPSAGVPAPTKITNKLVLTDPTTTGTVGVAYSSRAILTNGTGRIFWHITGGALPPGLLLEDQTGFAIANTASIGIAGTPTIGGSYPFTLMASDSLGNSISHTITITIPVTANCGTIIAALDWTATGQAVHMVGATVSVTAVGVNFTDPVGGSLTAIITNTTGAPFSIKATGTCSGDSNYNSNFAAYQALFDGVSFGGVAGGPNGGGVNTWTDFLFAQNTYVIGVGETHTIKLDCGGFTLHTPSNMTYTATLLIECV